MTTAGSDQRMWRYAGRPERVKTFALCSGVFAVALGVRAWTTTWLTDFWGDSYHHWLVTRLTMQNGGAYSDYKGMEVVWSPLYHYVSILPLWLSGRVDIAPLHLMNVLLGALTCALASYAAWRLFANRAAAFTAGAMLAVMSWHIAFSGMNVAEVFSGVLLLMAMTATWAGSDPARTPRLGHVLSMFLLAVAMSLTRPDLTVYLAIIFVWLCTLRRYAAAVATAAGVFLALAGWSLWSYSKTGKLLHWYQQYLANSRHDWSLLNASSGNPAFAFADYMNRLSPFVLPALIVGVVGTLTWHGAQRRNALLLTALLAGHSVFLIVGYARGVVPILTERYLALDLPLVAVSMGGLVVLIRNGADATARRFSWREVTGTWVGRGVATFLIALTAVRFWNDVPELEIRRWEIDPEWQVGNYLQVHVERGDIVLTDAPVAIYRSGRPPEQFISSQKLPVDVTASEALTAAEVDWIVTQPRSYDAAASFVPRALLEAHASGTVDGLHFEPVWRYDPDSTEMQAEVWHLSGADKP